MCNCRAHQKMEFYCKYCATFVHCDPMEMFRHYMVDHSHISDGYQCAYPMCYQRFKTKQAFRNHLETFHSSNAGMIFRCSMCSDKFVHKQSLMKHLHAHVNNDEKTQCPYCTYSTNISSTYRSHLARKHDANSEVCAEFQIVSAQSQESIRDPQGNPTSSTVNTVDNEHDDMETDSDHVESSPIIDDDKIEHMIATLFLKMQVQFYIPITSIEQIIETLNCIFSVERDNWLHNIKSALEKKNLPDGMIDTVMEIVADEIHSTLFDSTQPGASLSSDYRRNLYYKENMTYIEPIEIVLQKRTIHDKLESFQYIPIEPVLTEMVNKPDVLEEVMKPLNKGPDGQYSSYTDGKYFQEILRITGDDVSILLVLYTDDVEVCNPLGTSRKIHKLTPVYWTILNLPHHFKTKVQHIKMAVLSKKEIFDKYGIDEVLKPLLKDLRVLENDGLFVHSLGRTLKVAFPFWKSDNLGAHWFGNYNLSFSADQFCRVCLCPFGELHDKIKQFLHADSYTWRCPLTHDYHVQQASINESNISLYGVKKDCILHEYLKTFHVTRGLPPDGPHDLLEGLVPHEVAVALKHFTSKKFFTLNEFNEALDSFPYYHHDATNKPHAIPANYYSKKKVSIGGNCHENWTIIRLLPLILHNKVPEDDEFFEMLLYLKDIVEIAFAPVVDEGVLSVFDDLIQNHKKLFLNISGLKLKPKHHYLEHYPELMRCFGPLVNCNTMRDEAKHKSLKRVAKNIMNFMNISKSISVRHQLQDALHFESKTFLGDNDIEVHSESEMCIENMDCDVQDILQNVTESGFINVTDKVVINGMDYCLGMAVAVGFITGIPSFAIIELIVVHAHKVYFLVRSVNTSLNEKLHVYELTDTTEGTHYMLLEPSQLVHFYPLSVYQIGKIGIVSLKYYLVEKKM